VSSVVFECPHGNTVTVERGEREEVQCLLCFAKAVLDFATCRDGSAEQDEKMLGEIADLCREAFHGTGYDPDTDEETEEEEAEDVVEDGE
jgi:hypothetical protein